jgi:hypothetical protein
MRTAAPDSSSAFQATAVVVKSSYAHQSRYLLAVQTFKRSNSPAPALGNNAADKHVRIPGHVNNRSGVM